MNDYNYWHDEWVQKATQENAFEAAGASNVAKNPFEFLHTLHAVKVALRLRPTDTLLDVGCSTGVYPIALASSVKKITGVEYVSQFVQRAKKNCASYPNISIEKGDILSLPFRQHTFDAVLVNSVIQYVGDMDAVTVAIHELYRVTKKGGRVLIALIPDADKKQEYLDGIEKLPLTKARKRQLYEKNNRGMWFDRAQLRSLARETGFKVSILPVPAEVWQSWYMYSMLLEKKI